MIQKTHHHLIKIKTNIVNLLRTKLLSVLIVEQDVNAEEKGMGILTKMWPHNGPKAIIKE